MPLTKHRTTGNGTHRERVNRARSAKAPKAQHRPHLDLTPHRAAAKRISPAKARRLIG